ncbi:hypothetical protein MLD38_005879 [Melastoma candidum]|uniref:Uncharacterized protein n=1 Tax=Melastoma candidum TaxID=119954 RepID=A0ACB9RN16_9MYRT|nr:hypothetical protein MLD38_005879 [Melastoma candidum]
MAASPPPPLHPHLILTSLSSFLFLSTLFLSSTKTSSALTPNSPLNTNIPSLPSFCQALPYPDACLRSSKLSISITIGPTVLSSLLHSLQSAISEATKLSSLLLRANPYTVLERQRGTIQDCRDLHQITLSALRRSVSSLQSGDAKRLPDARAYLAAALTNRATCLEGLDIAAGPLKPALIEYIASTYQYVSNSLSMIRKPNPPNGLRPTKGRRLLEFPEWMPARDRRILQGGEGYDPGQLITVANDGSGNFSTISDAINFAPNNSNDRIFIYVVEGVYSENVEIPSYKTNIMLLGDGAGLTIVTGNRSVADGWTTFRSATVAVSGEGFLARDITFENTAGPKKEMDYYDAYNFTVSEFITADEWLGYTSVPYDDGI